MRFATAAALACAAVAVPAPAPAAAALAVAAGGAVPSTAAARIDVLGGSAPPADADAALAVADVETRASRPGARTLTLVASGDLLIHQPVWARALALGGGERYDFRPLFRATRPLLRGADLALCHVETPLRRGAPSGYPVFRTPPALARAIAWAGWDACSTASNHSVDQGMPGVRTTLRALGRAGVRHAGTARTRRESRRITLLDVGGVRIALLSYTYGTNGIPPPTSWSVNLIDARGIARDGRRARRRGADFVVVNLHWGAEYVHAPTSDQRTLARRLLRRRAVDLVLGQHAHVVQPIGRVRRRFVVYGEGNFLSAQSSACCPGPTQDGLVAVVRLRVEGGRARVRRVDYVPIYVRRPDYVVLPVGRRLRYLARHGGSASAEASALRASWRRTVDVVGRSARTRPLAGRG
ncbi:MAG TPA: CapA family protein [Gaiellaceae bacterium]|nr:CapA family protein [Gaiellaceae bacterium]